MKILIASDLHGSAKFTRELLSAFDAEGAELLVLLGDLYYHGVRNPLPEGYAPMEVAELLNERRERLIAVRGNCDSDVDLMVSKFALPKSSQIFADGRRIHLCHGDAESFDALPPLPAGSVFCQGHTHVSTISEREGMTLVNPGSVSLPKGGTPRGYALFDAGRVVLGKL